MIFFFTVIGITAMKFSSANIPFYILPIILITPIIIGVVLGFLASFILVKKALS